MLTYCSCLALTVAIELLVVRLWLMFDCGGQDMEYVLQAALGINLITHPFAWGAYVCIMSSWMGVEVIVVLVEAWALWSLRGRDLGSAVGLSVVMNGLSMAAGLAMTMLSL